MSLDVTISAVVETDVFSSNITHNLGRMAKEAGIYEYLWRPDEIGVTLACELVEPLIKGRDILKRDPERFKKFDTSNGWGTYEQFLPWLDEYIEACKQFPQGKVSVSR